MNLEDLLGRLHELEGSDLHLSTGSAPRVRVHGELVSLELPPLHAHDTERLALSVMTAEQRLSYSELGEVDFSFEVQGLARFRANVFTQRGSTAAVFRLIPFQIKRLRELRLPPVLERFSRRPHGLILAAGPTSCGKSTTLAALIDQINRKQAKHVITIEDPIEFLHRHGTSIVNQREISSDTPSFTSALRMALREDPDVVLVGEMRDPETADATLRIAETGHLTFTTLHTSSAPAPIHRLIDMFPPRQQPQARSVLALVLEGVICQLLIRRQDRSGQVAAPEILIPNLAIRNLIRENKVHQIYSAMQTGQEKTGMLTMNQSLRRLFLEGAIAPNDCHSNSPNPTELKDLVPPATGLGSSTL